MRAVLVCAVLAMCVSGIPAEDNLERIIKNGNWPWLVRLIGKIPIGKIPTYYYCGASVLNKRWLLTAAHCFKVPGAPAAILAPKYWHAYIGEKINKTRGGWLHSLTFSQKWHMHVKADEIITHPGFDLKTHCKNDIALIRVATDLPVGPEDPNIGPVSLPPDGAWPTDRSTCIIKAWGCSRDGLPLDDLTKKVKLKVYPSQMCDLITYGDIEDSQFCGGYTLEQKRICQSDSGAPLLCKDRSNTWQQAGIAAFACPTTDGRGLFMRVASYRTWINSIINNKY